MKDANGVVILCGNGIGCKFYNSCYRTRTVGPKKDFRVDGQDDCKYFIPHDVQNQKGEIIDQY